ncbi:MAG: zf-HC2 domain-containing protein [Spirochaetaceae bacterium]|jgi:hypothetical protein|nr:zf-HC2 domain-containing protein [Spirochaetaceae bacterium]
MCPNKQYLSVYFDDELPSPWKERMEQHIESCSECRKSLERYKKTSGLLNGGGGRSIEDGLMESAKLHVLEKIGAAGWTYSPYRLDDGKIRLPHIPQTFTAAAVGAIAAAALIFIMFFIAPLQSDKNGRPNLSAVDEKIDAIAVSSDYELDIPQIMPALDMDEVLRYIENDDSSNIVIIKLPERKKFNRYGEPAFINAADYSRGVN